MRTRRRSGVWFEKQSRWAYGHPTPAARSGSAKLTARALLMGRSRACCAQESSVSAVDEFQILAAAAAKTREARLSLEPR